MGISSAGFLLIGVVFMGGVAGRRRIIALVALLLMSGMLLVSCGGDPPPPPPPNEVSSIVTGLSPNTTYFWKVVAKDGNEGSTNSAVRSLTTKG
ncbi:MAG: fibronectin type III domain-containing protein [Nitrospirae bacterium]|nr:fibronectin type III domain-containing protein [Candidatus Troglogloeales bacterium]